MDKITIVIEKDEDSGYNVHCPEIPGLLTCGDTIQESLAMTIDAYECIMRMEPQEWDAELAQLLSVMRGDK